MAAATASATSRAVTRAARDVVSSPEARQARESTRKPATASAPETMLVIEASQGARWVAS
jgi:hypothetical protein